MSDRQPDLTVIVRTCGRSSVFLRRALASLRAQTCAPTLVIVVNDGPERADVDAEVTRFAVGGTAVRHLWRDPAAQPQPNRSAALNRGIAAATTRWVAFLDDDDTWSPQFVTRILPTLVDRASQPDFGGVIVQTEAVYERLEKGRIVEKRRTLFNRGFLAIDLATLAVENRFTLNALVIRRDVFGAVGGYREDLPVLEDWEFNLRAAVRFHFEVIPEALARYHLREPGDSAPNTPVDEMTRTGARIRNEWLRADIASGRLGLGQLSLAGESRGMASELSRWSRWRSTAASLLGRSPR